jgi:hypothetical protein
MGSVWSLIELEDLTKADKKLLKEHVAHEIANNLQIKKILRQKTRVLKNRLAKTKVQASSANVLPIRKA